MGPMLAMIMAPMGKAGKAVAVRIRAGEFSSPEEVAAALAEEMQKAGGFMAEIFLDAGTCSGVEPGLILSAHNAAGDGGSAQDLNPHGYSDQRVLLPRQKLSG